MDPEGKIGIRVRQCKHISTMTQKRLSTDDSKRFIGSG